MINKAYFHFMQQRAQILNTLRFFFAERGFLEVDTPISIKAPAIEEYISAPRVLFSEAQELPSGFQSAEERFLQTSPELSMKRLLALGAKAEEASFAKLYQLAPVFRVGDDSPLHKPEFRLLEWYRLGAHYTELLTDCEELLVTLAGAVANQASLAALLAKRPWLRISVDEAFKRYAGFSWRTLVEGQDFTSPLFLQRLQGELARLAIPYGEEDSFEVLFHRVFLNVVEPKLLKLGVPFFLIDYPAPLAALARLNPHDPYVAERFELYAGGLELANGFGELTDPALQRLRFQEAARLRRQKGLVTYPLDEVFLRDLAVIPQAAGIALGFERLLMVLLGAKDIDEVAFIPWSQI